MADKYLAYLRVKDADGHRWEVYVACDIVGRNLLLGYNDLQVQPPNNGCRWFQGLSCVSTIPKAKEAYAALLNIVEKCKTADIDEVARKTFT